MITCRRFTKGLCWLPTPKLQKKNGNETSANTAASQIAKADPLYKKIGEGLDKNRQVEVAIAANSRNS